MSIICGDASDWSCIRDALYRDNKYLLQPQSPPICPSYWASWGSPRSS